MKINSEYWISWILFPSCLTCCFLLVSSFPTWGWSSHCGCPFSLNLAVNLWQFGFCDYYGVAQNSKVGQEWVFLIKKIVYHSLFLPQELCVLPTHPGCTRIQWKPLAWCPLLWRPEFWKSTSELFAINPYLSGPALLSDSESIPFNVVWYELYQVTHMYPF